MNRALRTFGVLTAGLLLLSGLAHAPAVADEPTTAPRSRRRRRLSATASP
jgi:hypothetical protein